MYQYQYLRYCEVNISSYSLKQVQMLTVDSTLRIDSDVFLLYGSTTVAFGWSPPDWAYVSFLVSERSI